jgi:hypothetical protein
MDRSDRKVDLHLLDLQAKQEDSATLSTDPAALQAWATDLRQRFAQHRIAIVFEQPANNLIGFLSRYDWVTLYPINPISLQKFREIPPWRDQPRQKRCRRRRLQMDPHPVALLAGPEHLRRRTIPGRPPQGRQSNHRLGGEEPAKDSRQENQDPEDQVARRVVAGTISYPSRQKKTRPRGF